LQPRNKRAFEYTAVTIVPVLFSTIKSELFFNIRYENDIRGNVGNGNNGNSKQQKQYFLFMLYFCKCYLANNNNGIK